MPTNKNASIRYQTLDKCFRDFSHRYYIDDLIAKCEETLPHYNGTGGVSRRQFLTTSAQKSIYFANNYEQL